MSTPSRIPTSSRTHVQRMTVCLVAVVIGPALLAVLPQTSTSSAWRVVLGDARTAISLSVVIGVIGLFVQSFKATRAKRREQYEAQQRARDHFRRTKNHPTKETR